MKGLKSWHPIRWIFLIAGISVGIFAYVKYDAALGLVSLFISYQAIMNVGCVKTCYAWQRGLEKSDKAVSHSDEITYEEIL